MNVREMHIEMDQSLGQVAGNRNRKYQPEEKDFILNKIMARFIEDSIKARPDGSGGFEVDQQNVDRIRTLIVSHKDLVPYIDPGKNRYKCYLPHDYNYLLADWSISKELCGELPLVQGRGIHVTGLRQERSSKNTPQYYITGEVTIKGKSFVLPGSLTYGHSYSGFPRAADVNFFAPYIALKQGWYWEKAGDLYFPEHYIRISEDIGTGITRTVVDGNTPTPVLVSQSLSASVHTNSGGTVKSNRLLPSNKVKEFVQTAFYKSAAYSPISELAENILYIYNDSSFIVSGVGISYVRKPQPISLSLNTSCELPSQSCQKICDLAIEYIKGRNENVQGQQLAERNNDKRVIL